jgi:hypothetical protein
MERRRGDDRRYAFLLKNVCRSRQPSRDITSRAASAVALPQRRSSRPHERREPDPPCASLLPATPLGACLDRSVARFRIQRSSAATELSRSMIPSKSGSSATDIAKLASVELGTDVALGTSLTAPSASQKRCLAGSLTLGRAAAELSRLETRASANSLSSNGAQPTLLFILVPYRRQRTVRCR